jgi:hypothetical protein
LGAVKEDLSYFLIVFKVHIRELTYKLTIFQALDVYQEEMTHYINLMNYRHNKELQSQNVEIKALMGKVLMEQRGTALLEVL